MNYLNFSFILLLFLLLIININGQLIEITPPSSLSLIIENPKYVSFQSSTNSIECKIFYKALIYNNDTDNINLDSFISSGIGQQPIFALKTDDNSVYYYDLFVFVPFDSSEIINLTLKSNTMVQTIYQLNQTCINVAKKDIVYELDHSPFLYIDIFWSIFKINDEDSDIFSVIANSGQITETKVKNYYSVMWISVANIGNSIINETWSFPITFNNGKTVTISTKSYWYYQNKLPNLPYEYSFYPIGSNTSNSIYTEFGNNYPPLLKVKIKTDIIKPYFYFCADPQCNFNTKLKPIKGIKGDMEFLTSVPFTSYLNNFTISTANNDSIVNTQIETKFNKFNFPLLNNVELQMHSETNPIFIFSITFNTTTQYKFTKYSYSYLNRQLTKDWPFGFKSGSNLNYTHSTCFLYYMYKGDHLNSFFQIQTQNKFDYSSIDIYSDQNANLFRPIVTSYKFIHVVGYNYILSMDIESLNGVQYILVDSISYGSETLVKGDYNSGTYEIPLNNMAQNFRIVDSYNNFFAFSNDQFISLNPLIKFENTLSQQLKYFNYTDLMNISYSINDLNVQDNDNYINVYLNSTLPHDTTFSVTLINPLAPSSSYMGFDTEPFIYNSSSGLFTNKFILKKNSMFGNLLVCYGLQLKGLFFNSLFPESNQLRVKYTRVDNQGPLFKKIEKIGDGLILNNDGNNGNIGWKFTITDDINGFDSGYVMVKGSIDSSVYRFNFTTNDFLPGSNEFEGVYQLLINVTAPCISQQFTIVYIELYDIGKILSLFDLYNNLDPSVSPFINLYENSIDGGISITSVSLQCPSYQFDTSNPTLLSFTSSKSTIDVGLIDRTVNFTFEIIPSVSGIKVDQSPIIYLTSRRMESFECVSTLIISNSTYALYTCNTQLPLGFGYPGNLLLSVYGFVNNGGNFYGFSTFDLLNSNSNFYIITEFTVYQPILISNQKYYSDGDELIIYGKSLSTIDQVNIIDSETGTVIQSFGLNFITIYASSAIKITGIIPTEKQFYIMAYSSVLVVNSNKLLVNPIYFKLTPQYIPPPEPSPTPTESSTPIPTNPPKNCLGNPVCGGEKHGYCAPTGCICFEPWIGSDCTSQIIIVPQPSINTTNPSTEIPTLPIDIGSNNNLPAILFKSLISLVSLREIDYNGQQVSNYQFEKWIYTPITELKNRYTTSVLNTNITATLEWFNTSTIISFANQNLTMQPSSIKYTIEIDGNYEFKNKLNQLQLIMLASFESTKSNDICSNLEFGNTTTGDDSNYLKIQIDNHSLYGRFIKRAIIDGEFRGITNQLLDSSLNVVKSSSIQSYVAITIPQFKDQIIIDPDFSVLLDSNKASSLSDSICSKSSKLTGAQLAGIIVGSVAFSAVIVISITYAIIRNRNQKKFLKSVNNKLKNVN